MIENGGVHHRPAAVSITKSSPLQRKRKLLANYDRGGNSSSSARNIGFSGSSLFSSNFHLVGFQAPGHALVQATKEMFENALDATTTNSPPTSTHNLNACNTSSHPAIIEENALASSQRKHIEVVIEAIVDNDHPLSTTRTTTAATETRSSLSSGSYSSSSPPSSLHSSSSPGDGAANSSRGSSSSCSTTFVSYLQANKKSRQRRTAAVSSAAEGVDNTGVASSGSAAATSATNNDDDDTVVTTTMHNSSTSSSNNTIHEEEVIDENGSGGGGKDENIDPIIKMENNATNCTPLTAVVAPSTSSGTPRRGGGMESTTFYRVTVRDNGCGMEGTDVPLLVGSLYSSTKKTRAETSVTADDGGEKNMISTTESSAGSVSNSGSSTSSSSGKYGIGLKMILLYAEKSSRCTTTTCGGGGAGGWSKEIRCSTTTKSSDDIFHFVIGMENEAPIVTQSTAFKKPATLDGASGTEMQIDLVGDAKALPRLVEYFRRLGAVKTGVHIDLKIKGWKPPSCSSSSGGGRSRQDNCISSYTNKIIYPPPRSGLSLLIVPPSSMSPLSLSPHHRGGRVDSKCGGGLLKKETTEKVVGDGTNNPHDNSAGDDGTTNNNNTTRPGVFELFDLDKAGVMVLARCSADEVFIGPRSTLNKISSVCAAAVQFPGLDDSDDENVKSGEISCVSSDNLLSGSSSDSRSRCPSGRCGGLREEEEVRRSSSSGPQPDGYLRILRYCNGIPILDGAGECTITNSVLMGGVNWPSYGLRVSPICVRKSGRSSGENKDEKKSTTRLSCFPSTTSGECYPLYRLEEQHSTAASAATDEATAGGANKGRGVTPVNLTLVLHLESRDPGGVKFLNFTKTSVSFEPQYHSVIVDSCERLLQQLKNKFPRQFSSPLELKHDLFENLYMPSISYALSDIIFCSSRPGFRKRCINLLGLRSRSTGSGTCARTILQQTKDVIVNGGRRRSDGDDIHTATAGDEEERQTDGQEQQQVRVIPDLGKLDVLERMNKKSLAHILRTFKQRTTGVKADLVIRLQDHCVKSGWEPPEDSDVTGGTSCSEKSRQESPLKDIHRGTNVALFQFFSEQEHRVYKGMSRRRKKRRTTQQQQGTASATASKHPKKLIIPRRRPVSVEENSMSTTDDDGAGVMGEAEPDEDPPHPTTIRATRTAPAAATSDYQTFSTTTTSFTTATYTSSSNRRQGGVVGRQEEEEQDGDSETAATTDDEATLSSSTTTTQDGGDNNNDDEDTDATTFDDEAEPP